MATGNLVDIGIDVNSDDEYEFGDAVEAPSTSTQWQDNHGNDVLQKLGILDNDNHHNRIDSLPSEPDSSTAPLKQNRHSSDRNELSDDDFDVDEIYNKKRLLKYSPGSRSSSRWLSKKAKSAVSTMTGSHASVESRRALTCRALLIGLTYLTIGMCVSMPGVTLPDIQGQFGANPGPDRRSVFELLAASSFGALLGISFGGLALQHLSGFCVMAVVMGLTAAFTISLPWCKEEKTFWLDSFLQSICLGLLERAGFCLYSIYWRRRINGPRALLVFYACMAVGSCIGPMITTPFVAGLINKQFNDSIDLNLADRLRRQELFNPTQPVSEISTDNTNPNVTLDTAPKKPTVNVNTNKQDETPLSDQAEKGKQEALGKQNAALNTSTSTSITTTTTTTSTTTSAPLHEMQTSEILANLNAYKDQWWNLVVLLSSKVSRYQFAYLVVGVITLVSTGAFIFMCLCVACTRLQKVPNDGDARSALNTLCASNEARLATVLSMLVGALVAGVEATVCQQTTAFYIISRPPGNESTDGAIASSARITGAFLTSVYFGGVIVSRILAILFYARLSSSKQIVLALAAGNVVSLVLSIFGASNDGLLWILYALLGLTTGSLVPITYINVEAHLNTPAWFSAIWLMFIELGRILYPFFCGVALSNESNAEGVLLSINAGLALAFFIYFFDRRLLVYVAHTIGAPVVTDTNSKAMNGNYTRIRFDATTGLDADDAGNGSARLSTDRMDDDLLADVDDTVVFDRQRGDEDDDEDGEISGSIFDRYTTATSKGKHRRLR